jgi:hypothetical protein
MPGAPVPPRADPADPADPTGSPWAPAAPAAPPSSVAPEWTQRTAPAPAAPSAPADSPWAPASTAPGPPPYDNGPGGHWAPPVAGPPPTAAHDPWAPAPFSPQAPTAPTTPPAGEPQADGPAGKRRKRLVIAGVVVVLLVIGGLVARSLGGGPADAERNGSGAIVDAGDLSAFSFRPGDCWDDPPLDQVVDSVAAVPCTQPHDAEVYAVFDLDLPEYPGDDEVGTAAESGCIGRFAEFTGVEYAASRLEVVYLNPTQESWDEEDDRSVVCSVSDPEGPATGSLRGAAR